MWFCKKEKFSITDENIEKLLKGHNFAYSGDMPHYFAEVVRKYKNTVDAYESVFKALFKDIPETDLIGAGIYPNSVVQAWKIGEGFYPKPPAEKVELTRQEYRYIKNALLAKNGNFCSSCGEPMDISNKAYNLINTGEEVRVDISENTKNNSQCISYTTLKHLKCLQQGVATTQEKTDE